MVNDLPRDHQIFCQMFADDTKLGAQSETVSSIKLNRNVEWHDHNDKLINAAKSHHFCLEREPYLSLVFLGPDGVPVSIPQAHRAKDLEILVDSSLSFYFRLVRLNNAEELKNGFI